MQRRVKLIKLQQTHQQYYILQDQILGTGGFSQVKKVISPKHPDQIYAVKIINYNNQHMVKNIKKQLAFLHKLPDHPNLVKTKLLNCYSDNNYYIFMEYCDDSLFQEAVNKKFTYTQQQIYKIFYQLMQGYKILYENQIVHQDIKLENILIKNGSYKIADFGLSVIAGQKPGKIAGTRIYIAPQKFKIKQLKITSSVDIYSFGILFFILIIGQHPYINYDNITLKQFIKYLNNSQLNLQKDYNIKYSIQFKQFFDIILQMIKLNPQQRISFQQILLFISQNKKIFSQLQQSKSFSHKQTEISYKNFVITGISRPRITSLLAFKLIQKQKADKLVKQIELEEQKKKRMQEIKQLIDYIMNRRAYIYFFDKLSRRIIVEQDLKNKQKNKIWKLILGIGNYNEKMGKQIIYELKQCKIFGKQRWKKLGQSEEAFIIELAYRDLQNIEQNIILFESESGYSKIQLCNIAKIFQQNSENTINYIKELLLQTIKQKNVILEYHQRKKKICITLKYLIDTLLMINDQTKWKQFYFDLQTYYRNTSKYTIHQLIQYILLNGQKLHLTFGLDISQIIQQI